MATRTWIGSAPKVAEVTAYVLGGTWDATDVINMTIGTVTVPLTVGSTSTTTIAALMATTWNALLAANYPQFKELTASSNTATFTLTANTAGLPFTVTIATTEPGGGAPATQTIDGGASSTGTDTTANSSPNQWSLAANWAEGVVPVAADDVNIERGSVDILYGLAQSAVTLTSLTIKATYTGKIGLPTRNATGYEEYRATQLAISATTCTIGQGQGSGSGRIKLNFGSVQTALTVYGMATSAETGLAALLWRGTHASNVVNVYSGTVGVAIFSGETAVIATLRQTGGTVKTASGTTLMTIDKSAGSLETFSSATTITNRGGDITVWSGAHTTINLLQDKLAYNSTGTLTTLNVYDAGEANFDEVNQARTVTNCTIVEGAKISDKAKTVTWTNGIILSKCGIEAVTLLLGEDITITRS